MDVNTAKPADQNRVLFHTCPVLLAPGSVLMPGNWGRVLTNIGSGHQSYAREIALEAVRIAHYPAKPSRLGSTYALTSLQTAIFYRECNNKNDALYVVRKLEPDAPEHIADYNCIQPLARRTETMEQIAHRYWRADLWITISERPDIRCEELVTSSPLIVLGHIQP